MDKNHVDNDKSETNNRASNHDDILGFINPLKVGKKRISVDFGVDRAYDDG